MSSIYESFAEIHAIQTKPIRRDPYGRSRSPAERSAAALQVPSTRPRAANRVGPEPVAARSRSRTARSSRAAPQAGPRRPQRRPRPEARSPCLQTRAKLRQTSDSSRPRAGEATNGPVASTAADGAGTVAAHDPFRGEPIALLAGGRTAEAIVPPIEPDDRYPGRRPPGGSRRRGIEVSPTRSRDARRPADESAHADRLLDARRCPAWRRVPSSSGSHIVRLWFA